LIIVSVWIAVQRILMKMNKNAMHRIFKFLFLIQMTIGGIDILFNKHDYSFPPNMGWIIINGLACLVLKEE
jgi:hypothetical protein